jgi:hypothetical protein
VTNLQLHAANQILHHLFFEKWKVFWWLIPAWNGFGAYQYGNVPRDNHDPAWLFGTVIFENCPNRCE